MSRTKRFKSVSNGGTVGLYHPKWSYGKTNLKKGGTFGTSKRFEKFDPKKNRNYLRRQSSMNEYSSYIPQSSIKNPKGGSMPRSRRFKSISKSMKTPGPGTYGVNHALNHSRLPYAMYTKRRR